MNLRFAAVLMGLVLTLAGCGVFGGAGNTLGVHFQPTLLGFEVDDTGGITIASNNVHFSNARGGQEARVISYTVNYVDTAGAPVLGGTYDLRNELGSAVIVPPGYVCEGEDASCGPFDRLPSVQESAPIPYILLAGPIAVHMLATGADVVGLVTFTVEQGGRTFDLETELSVTYPVGAE